MVLRSLSLLILHSRRWLYQKGMLRDQGPSSSSFPAPSKSTPLFCSRERAENGTYYLSECSFPLPAHLTSGLNANLLVSCFPTKGSKLTLFMLFCSSISTPNPLLIFSYCRRMSCNELCLFKTPPPIQPLLVSCLHWGRQFTWTCDKALWAIGGSGVCGAGMQIHNLSTTCQPKKFPVYWLDQAHRVLYLQSWVYLISLFYPYIFCIFPRYLARVR